MDKFGAFNDGRISSSHTNRIIYRYDDKLKFGLTEEGHINVRNRRLCNLVEPERENDAATKKYVETVVMDANNVIHDYIKNQMNNVEKTLKNLATLCLSQRADYVDNLEKKQSLSPNLNSVIIERKRIPNNSSHKERGKLSFH